MTTFSSLFETFTNRAFRYESLPAYASDEEAEALGAYLRGANVPTAWHDGWVDFLVRARELDRTVERVRLIPDPPTSYFEFERLHGYSRSVEAGEAIYGLRESDLPDDELLASDFWLFDASAAAVMKYDEAGRFQGAELVENPSQVSRYCSLADRLITAATKIKFTND